MIPSHPQTGNRLFYFEVMIKAKRISIIALSKHVSNSETMQLCHLYNFKKVTSFSSGLFFTPQKPENETIIDYRVTAKKPICRFPKGLEKRGMEDSESSKEAPFTKRLFRTPVWELRKQSKRIWNNSRIFRARFEKFGKNAFFWKKIVFFFLK